MHVDPSLSSLNSIHHDGSVRYVRYQHSTEPRLGDTVTIRMRAAPDVPIERIFLRTAPDGEQKFTELQPEDGCLPGESCRWWQVKLTLTMPVTSYRFLIFSRLGVFWLNGSGLHQNTPTDEHDFRLLADYVAPTWVRDAVFYQIFPDRFADGDPSTNVRSGEYTYSGHSTIASGWNESPRTIGGEAMIQFYGGDLVGIQKKLDYLEKLGVNALYLNPIFTAYSNHRYDVVDYYHVDPHLGGNGALAELRQALKERGMKFILDIVPNHCGVLHPWFQQAYSDPTAPTADYFTFNKHPDDYACWLGVRSLPKFNYRSSGLRDVMYLAPDAIFRRWMQAPFSIDGWRLDVANMLARQGADQLGVEVGRDIRKAIKEENPDAYILGENFFDASSQLQGDMWDASMNYSGFCKPVWYWLEAFEVRLHGHTQKISSPVSWPTTALVDTWQVFRAAIPWAIARQQFNLLGSHDTPRILTRVDGDGEKNRVAITLLMTYPGVPSIYYGDEVGLNGEGSMRAPMPWDPSDWDGELQSFYQKLIHLRRSSSALVDGGFQVLLVMEDSLVYLRDTADDQMLIRVCRRPLGLPGADIPVINGGIADGVRFQELLSGQTSIVSGGVLPVSSVPAGAQIWRREN